MINNAHSGQSSSYNRPSYRALARNAAILPEADYQKLQEHLESCKSGMRASSALLVHVLSHKLMNVNPVSNVHCSDLVIGGSRVTYSVDGGKPQEGLLSHRAAIGSTGGVIPVASLLGTTLMGMRTGQRAPLLRDDGTIGRLLVIDVTQSN